MPADALSQLQASVARTATLNGNSFDLRNGTPVFGLGVRIRFSAASVSASTGSATFRLQESDDNSTWRDLVSFDAVALSTTAAAGLRFEGFITRSRYVRLQLAAISGTDATITYEADIVPAMP